MGSGTGSWEKPKGREKKTFSDFPNAWWGKVVVREEKEGLKLTSSSTPGQLSQTLLSPFEIIIIEYTPALVGAYSPRTLH